MMRAWEPLLSATSSLPQPSALLWGRRSPPLKLKLNCYFCPFSLAGVLAAVWLLLEVQKRIFGEESQTNPSSLLRNRSSALAEGQEFWACHVVSEPSLSLSLSSLFGQAGRKTYAMVSSHSAGHSLASELVESHDGHEEIIKVSLVHLQLFSLSSSSLHVYEREQLTLLPKGACGWMEGTRPELLVPGNLLEIS